MIDIGQIIAFENGDLDEADTIRLFSTLVSTGAAWTLQGFYGRTAASLIDNGILDADGNILIDLDAA
jgi:hypothetical protein